MTVTVVCFGAMREYLPSDATGNETNLEMPGGATVGDIADRLRAPRSLVHAILVNEEPSDLSRTVTDGDRITLMPHYSGG